MNNTDRLTAMAVKGASALKAKDREVETVGGTSVRVILHGQACLTYDTLTQTIEVDGSTPPTRKSTRLVNAVLSAFGPSPRVSTRRGQWYLNTTDGKPMPFSNKIASVPVNIN